MNYKIGDSFFIQYISWKASADKIKATYPDWRHLYLTGHISAIDYDNQKAKFSVPALLRTYERGFDYFGLNFVVEVLPVGGRVLSMEERVLEEGIDLVVHGFCVVPIHYRATLLCVLRYNHNIICHMCYICR